MATPAQGEEPAAYPPRAWYRKVPFVRARPIYDPVCVPEKSADDVEEGREPENPTFPEMRANLFSKLTFQWLSRILTIGYTRPLNAEELYSMPEHRTAQYYAERLEAAWERRVQAAKKAQAQAAAAGKVAPTKATLRVRALNLVRLRKTTGEDMVPKPSLLWALNDVIFEWFWIGGVMKLVGDLAMITSPLMVRAIIKTLSDDGSSYQQKRGFGLGTGLFLLLLTSVFGNVHGFYRAYSTGIALRGALIHVIYLRGTKLSERARTTGLGVGKLMSLVSADVSRIDFCCGYFHMAWTSVVQVVVCLALMIYSLGYSALPGFALVLTMYPLQDVMVKKLFALRRKSMPLTDARIKAVVEVVASIRLIKTYAWENPLLAKVAKLRGAEMNILKKRLLLRSLNTAVSFTMPTIAAVISFICYSATGHELQSDVIFSSLSFFLLLRTPLMMLPIALSSIADAKAALERLTLFMNADLREPDPPIQEDLPDAIQVRNAAFIHHDEDLEEDERTEVGHDDKTPDEKEKHADPPASPSSGAPSGDDEKTSLTTAVPHKTRLRIHDFTVKRGELVVVVGAVGSGKSSLLRALLGDMREVSYGGPADLRLGGAVAYCPQTAWLLSATIRENIVFGRHYDPIKYDETLRKCCLGADLAVLPEGDMTVVGEKGVSLSGGQKQRISLARAVYSGEDRPLRLYDDCFSALDAHVGAQVFNNVILEEKAFNVSRAATAPHKQVTHLLVTHSLAIVPHADRVVFLEGGEVREQGAFAELMARDGPFARLMKYGVKQQGGDEEENEADAEANADAKPAAAKDLSATEAATQPETQTAVPEVAADKNNGASAAAVEKSGGAEADKADAEKPSADKPAADAKPKDVMQKEERLVGSVTWRTYVDYILLGHAPVTAPLFITSILVFQATTILSPLWLSWWEDERWPQLSQGTYMGVYAALGFGQSIGLFCMSASFALFAYYTSNHIHARAAKRILHAPLSFFDTTPQGRITHRFSKDIDAVDNVVGETLRLFISTAVQALGSVILVALILPYFLAIAAIVVILYVWTGMFYRPAARELRRLNNVLRSKIYEHFSESLTGINTLRAYDALRSFQVDNARRIDSENRAYWLSIACQRWLNLRLDSMGALLCFATALLVVGLRGSISSSSGGVVLSYMVTVQSVFGQMIRQSAEIENNMNSIERLLHYAHKVPQEAPHTLKTDAALEKRGWPERGAVRFEGLTASHRPELDPALRGVNLDIKAGEKIGVVGRTGAGKSTLLSSLLRVMESSQGRVTIDGVDTREVGLSLLRRQISVISQDAVLFAGTLRYNLDPFEEHTDADLWHAMKQARLVETEEPPSADTGAAAYAVDSGADAEIQPATPITPVTPTTPSTAVNGGATSRSRPLSLEMEIAADGSNLSQGQRALVSIARALVKQARIVVLDEATASVDVDTDAKIQVMLQDSLGECTFITVAHRLDTIVGVSDRVVVMEKGQVAEFDTPLALYERGATGAAQAEAAPSESEGAGGGGGAEPYSASRLFRQLCDSAGISREDIRKARQAVQGRAEGRERARAGTTPAAVDENGKDGNAPSSA